MGYSFCISTPRPPPGDRHSTQGPGVFTFTPAPVSSLVGWNGLRHPPARTMSHQSVNPIPDLSGQGRPRPETAHPAMPAHRQEYRGAPGSPETRNRGLTAVTGTFRPTGWDRTGGPSFSSITNRNRSMEAGFVESRAGAAVARLPSTSPDRRLGEWDGGNPDAAATGDSWRPLSGARRPVARAATPSPPRTLAMGPKRPVHLTSGQCTFGSMAACSTAVPAHGNGSGQARLEEPLYGCFFVGGSGPARSAPPVRPSAQPFSPPPRSTATERTSTHVAQPAAGNPSTNARPKEMPMKQRDPE